LGRSITVSTRVIREPLEEARRLGINVSELLRRTLEEERRRRLMSLEKSLREMHSMLDKIDVGEVVDLIREERETK